MRISSNLPADQRESICLNVLRELPSWFGNEAPVLDYAKQCRTLPFWAAFDGEQAVGFIALKPPTHSPAKSA